jgi:predicted O-methyltransferase YrrM
MTPEQWSAVDSYLADLFVPQDPALTAALEASAAAGLPPIQVSPTQGKFLMLLARLQGARRILEIGTLGGYSAICLSRALPSDGLLITLELEPAYAELARSNIERAGSQALVTVRQGAAIEILPALAMDGSAPFDLVFIDADKPSYPDYLEWSLKLTRPGSLIIADNVVRAGAILNPESDDPRVQGMRRFLARLAAEPSVRATVIQTVGGKGYDGFAVAVVLAEPGRS